MIVLSWPGPRIARAVCKPRQEIATADELEPPLYASRLHSVCVPMNVNCADVGPRPLKLMLVVGNCPYGPESHQLLVPQSITFAGYCPFKTRSGFGRASKV